MDPKAMEPQGLALLAYFHGNLNAELVIHRDDGVDDPMRVSHFFRHELAFEHGQVLLDSQDVRRTDNSSHLAYHEANRRVGRYMGEIRLQLAFQGQRGPLCGWLHVDVEMLTVRAELTGWRCELILQEDSGHYLARLTKARA